MAFKTKYCQVVKKNHFNQYLVYLLFCDLLYHLGLDWHHKQGTGCCPIALIKPYQAGLVLEWVTKQKYTMSRAFCHAFLIQDYNWIFEPFFILLAFFLLLLLRKCWITWLRRSKIFNCCTYVFYCPPVSSQNL